MPDVWMADLIRWIANGVGTDLFVVKSVLTLIVLCLLCGMVGALVVGNRMAFFSDAMAHCAFAGIALGLPVDCRCLPTVDQSESLRGWSRS